MNDQHAPDSALEPADAPPRKLIFSNRFTVSRDVVFCPPTGVFAKFLTSILVVVGAWAALLCFTDGGDFMMPDGLGFALVVVVVSGLIAGEIVQLFRLPGLLGMLITGILLRNLPGVFLAAVYKITFPAIWS
jgi:hypothetical protein